MGIQHGADQEPATLPGLCDTPKSYPGCCLALSRPLIGFLLTILPPSPDLVLSVGSGYGLLEALLLQPPHKAHVVGVEVQPSSNRYLPPENHALVIGSRFLEPLADEAAAWLFVYPKRVGLVEEYIRSHGKGNVRHIIWIGPKADWADYEGCFAVAAGDTVWNVKTQSADVVGGTSWEMIAIARKE